MVGHSQVLTNSRDTCVNTLVRDHLFAVMKAVVNHSHDQVISRLTSLFTQEKNLMFVHLKVHKNFFKLDLNYSSTKIIKL